jgi:hypothetical protein
MPDLPDTARAIRDSRSERNAIQEMASALGVCRVTREISGSYTVSRSTELVISELSQSVADLRTAALLMPEGSEALQAHQETH